MQSITFVLFFLFLVQDNWDDDEEEEKKKEEEKEEVEKKTGVVSGLEPSTSDTLWPHDRLIFLITTDDDDNIQSMNANNWSESDRFFQYVY